MKLLCPKCSNRSIFLLKVLISDIFGWAVRCKACETRTSHSKWVRIIVAVCIWIGFPIAYIFGFVPDQIFHVSQFVGFIFFLVLLLITIIVVFPLVIREDVLASPIKQIWRKAIIRALWVSGIYLVTTILPVWNVFDWSLFRCRELIYDIVLVSLIVSFVSIITENWTI